jgi:hypothetical protein
MLILALLSCNKRLYYGVYSKHFSNKEKKEIKIYKEHFNNFNKILIGIVEINKRKKIGLYSYERYGNRLSIGVFYKVLKFEDKIVFPSSDKEYDKKILDEFETKYSNYFTPDQLQKIRESFLLGSEFWGNFL